MVHKLPAEPRRSNSYSLFVVGAVAGVVLVAFLFTQEVIANTVSVSQLSTVVPYTEVPYTNVHRGADELCRAHEAERNRPSTHQWIDGVSKADASHQGAITGEVLMQKARLWPDKESGVLGRDRVLCAGHNHDTNLDRLALLYYKWANRCDKVLLFAPKADIGRNVPNTSVVEMHPYGGDDPMNLWQRFRFMVKHVTESPLLNDVDFVLFFGDDVWVSVPNLKKMLREPHFAEMDRLGVPLVFGHWMRTDTGEIFVGNSAFMMNHVALRIMNSLFEAGECKPVMTGATEDLHIGECLSTVGIRPFDTYDALGQDRITPFHPQQLADLAKHPNPDNWYVKYRKRPIAAGRDALSAFPVAYHYMDLAAIDAFEAAISAQSAASPDGYR